MGRISQEYKSEHILGSPVHCESSVPGSYLVTFLKRERHSPFLLQLEHRCTSYVLGQHTRKGGNPTYLLQGSTNNLCFNSECVLVCPSFLYSSVFPLNTSTVNQYPTCLPLFFESLQYTPVAMCVSYGARTSFPCR